MKAKIKSVLAMKYAKPIIYLVLFLVAGWTTYQAAIIGVPIVTHYGRGILDYLPTMLVGFVPIFSVFMILLYNHNFDVQNKWKVARAYGLIMTIAMSISLVLHIVMCSIRGTWRLGTVNISPLFPFDMVFFMTIALAIGILTLVWVYKNKAMKDVAKTSTYVIRKRVFVALAFVLGIGNWYLGNFYSVFLTIGPRVDANWPFMIPVFMLFLLPTIFLILFYIYKHRISDEKKKCFHLWALVGVSALTLALVIWTGAGLLINPRLVAESLSNFFLLGMAAKIPFGIFIIGLGSLAMVIICCIKFIKRYKPKHEQK